ncbi:MAG TPA: hypothetical protein VND24_06940, partial [Steroidobacteraceae bacterium]|nr:hypothetical protein [Steroidobacteraceae bacterium]
MAVGYGWRSSAPPANEGSLRVIGERMARGAQVGVAMALTVLGAMAPTGAIADAANAPPAPQGLQEIVINATPVAGSKIPIDDIPANVQILSPADLSRSGTASLTTALNSQLSSINVN